MRKLCTSLLILLLMATVGFSQNADHPIARQVQEKFQSAVKATPIDLMQVHDASNQLNNKYLETVYGANYYKMHPRALKSVRSSSPELMELSLPLVNERPLELKLFRVEEDRSPKVRIASNPESNYNYQLVIHYWGIVNDDEHSLASISFLNNELMGFLYYQGETYNLGRLRDAAADDYILFKESDVRMNSPLDCDTDPSKHAIGKQVEQHLKAENPDNCVNMYVEVDYDIFVGKGGVTEATQYVEGVFSQVSILYENESINLQVSEIFVWDIQDPYTGPSTSDYLTQFRDNLNGSYNGDLAHLVGYNGGGGIAYVDVICNDFYGIGYSDINSTYANVPTYSWTVMVVTHEIGHNLGSRHTHDCVWNGNSTAIDGCGPAAGYAGNGTCPAAAVPEAGTIMSYCHLVSGVGIDFNLGFGPQPGDLIRDRVYNSTCLQTCATPTINDAGISSIFAPSGTICLNSLNPEVELFNYGADPLTSVTIEYQLDAGAIQSYNWTGSLASSSATTVILPSISFADGSHSFSANTTLPNGVTDDDASNDGSSSNFNRPSDQTYYADNDGDGYGNPAVSLVDCVQPSGYVLDNTDCNDNDANAFPGASCSDGDVCTTNDLLDANCQCSGTYSDSDGDTVCDAEDQCPGEDDLIDDNNNGIPDGCECNTQFESFGTSNLTHTGSGSSQTSANLPADAEDAQFTISNLNALENGNPNNRFIDEARVEYVDGNGNTLLEGTYLGNNNSTVTVNITGVVQSITVYLSDAYDGNANGTLSIDLSQVQYCGQICQDADSDGVCDADDQCAGFDDNLLGTSCDDGDPCTTGDNWVSCNTCSGTYSGDSDGDGVCDAQDICEGGDDKVDTDGDGVPDFCDSDCDPVVNNFDVNPLNHTGGGSSFSNVNFDPNNQDVSFTISNLNSKDNGKPDSRYVEEVVVTYEDGNGATQNYGSFRGDQQSTVDVVINGAVNAAQVELRYASGTGGPESNMSVDLSEVNSCVAGSPLSQEFDQGTEPLQVKVYPNPASQFINVDLNRSLQDGMIVLRDVTGKYLGEYRMGDQVGMRIALRSVSLSSSVILVSVIEGEEIVGMERVMILR